MEKKDGVREIGKDEMNLVEFPITLLSKRHESDSRTLKFSDTIIGDGNKPVEREWTVTGSEEYGLPLAQDNDVLLALLALGKEKNFQSRKINFSRYKLCEIMGWTLGGSKYKRIEDALDRLKGISIKARNAFWDNERRAYVTRNFGIIDNYELLESSKPGPSGQGTFAFSYVNLNEVVFDSIKAGYIKSLDMRTYFRLESAITKRLYRYLDKKRYDGKRKFEINLYALAYIHLGFSDEAYKYASEIRRKLDPAHEELIKAGFLKTAEYQKTADGSSEKIIYTFGKKAELPENLPGDVEIQEDAPAREEDDLLEKLVQAGITRTVAEQIKREYAREDIMAQIKALPFRKAEDPAAVLVSSILNKWNIPASCQEKMKKEKQKVVEREQRDEEEREKAERRGRIEKYLAAQSRDEQVELIAEARELARQEGGAYFKDKEIPQYMINAYMHIVVEKRLEL
jgi:plasmid replication initiation protein